MLSVLSLCGCLARQMHDGLAIAWSELLRHTICRGIWQPVYKMKRSAELNANLLVVLKCWQSSWSNSMVLVLPILLTNWRTDAKLPFIGYRFDNRFKWYEYKTYIAPLVGIEYWSVVFSWRLYLDKGTGKGRVCNLIILLCCLCFSLLPMTSLFTSIWVPR